jgi:hypothetical protein
LNDDYIFVRSNTVSALTKLADHGETALIYRQTSLMHSKVELYDIIKARILSLDGIVEDVSHFQLDTGSLLGRLDQFRKKRDEANWFEKDDHWSSEDGDEGEGTFMDIA